MTQIPNQAEPAGTPPEFPVETPVTAPESKHRYLPYLLPILVLTIIAAGFTLTKINAPVPPDQLSYNPPKPQLFLTIASPNKATTAVNGEVLVTGSTLPGATIAMYTDTDEGIIDAASDGSFEGSLLVGENGGLLKVTAIAPGGNEISQTVELFGSDVLGKTDAPGQMKKTESTDTGSKNTGGPSNAGVSVETKKDKPTDAPKKIQTPKPTAVIGPSDEKKNIQSFLFKKTQSPKPTKLGNAKLKELLSDDSTGSAKINRGQLKKLEVKSATGGAVLKRHAIQGVITAIDGGTLTVAHQIQRDRLTTVYVNVDTVISSKNSASGSAGLVVGARIAAVGEPAGSGILAKRIHIIPGKAVGIFTKNPVATAGGETVTPTPISSVSTTLTPTETPIVTDTVTPTDTQAP